MSRRKPGPRPAKGFDLLELARPASEVPWAYVKVAEGCDRICGFCAIPSFRGKQRSRHVDEVMAEVELLLAGGTTPVGRDGAAGARDRAGGPGPGVLRPGPLTARASG